MNTPLRQRLPSLPGPGYKVQPLEKEDVEVLLKFWANARNGKIRNVVLSLLYEVLELRELNKENGIAILNLHRERYNPNPEAKEEPRLPNSSYS